MKVHQYQGKDIIISYDVQRCIHAAECVAGSREAFNPEHRPWIDANAAPAAQIATIIHRCPTGALHYRAADPALAETPDEINTITTHPNGPLYVRGRITVLTEAGDTQLEDVRVALCRCGASKNKPFCDNSHLTVAFEDAGNPVRSEEVAVETASGSLSITSTADGPLHAEGPVRILNARGDVILAGKDTWLCRCGGSANKPFCDGSHSKINFRSG